MNDEYGTTGRERLFNDQTLQEIKHSKQ